MPATSWGIIGTGRISGAFARDLAFLPDARLAAVGSRTLDRASAFARAHGGEATSAYGSYAELVADPDVDVVYIGTPHSCHLADARLALEAGKPVLVEKPIGLNQAEGQELFDLARARGLFAMEAMWMACHPLVRTLRSGLADGRWGQPRQVHADLGFLVEAEPSDRLVDPTLGAGALLDMGIYPVTFAHLMLGPPESQVAVASLSTRGYDEDVAIAGRYGGGATAALTSSMTSWSPRAATIATTTGLIDVPAPFHHSPYAVYWPGDSREPVRIEAAEPVIGTGLANEAAEVMRCLAEGLLESPLVPHAQTLSIMGQLDALRAQLGVRYEGDR